MRAADVMSEGVVSVSSDATVFEAAQLLVQAHVSAMPVVDRTGLMVGIVSEADLMRRPEIGTSPHKSWLRRWLANDVLSAAEYASSHSRRVRDVMTASVVTVEESATLADVAETMLKHNVKRVPVLRDGIVAGIVSRADLMYALMSRDPQADPPRVSDEELRRAVRKAVDRQSWSSRWPTNVFVNAGVVHLWGYVSSEATRKAYAIAAENVPGVKKVKNHMRPIPPEVLMGT